MGPFCDNKIRLVIEFIGLSVTVKPPLNVFSPLNSSTALGHEARLQMCHQCNGATAMVYVVSSQEPISQNAPCSCC
jgi:hypothetical protein